MIRKITLTVAFIAAIIPAMAGEPVIYNQSQLMVPPTEPNHIVNKAYVDDNFATEAYVDEADSRKADLVDGVVPSYQIPPEFRTNFWSVATSADLVTLTDATQGDIALITSGDESGHEYVLSTNDPTVQSNWILLSGGGGGGGGGVVSVNNMTGVVTVDLENLPGVQNALDDKANASDVPALSSTAPVMDGTASAGTAITASRGDHRHPSDTTKANLASPIFTGTPTAPTASTITSNTQIATTAFVKNAISGKADTTELAAYLPLTGGTINGTIYLNDSMNRGIINLGLTYLDSGIRANKNSAFYIDTTGSYVFRYINNGNFTSIATISNNGTLSLSGGLNVSGEFNKIKYGTTAMAPGASLDTGVLYFQYE